MSEVLTTCDKIELLPNGTLALFKDTNNVFSLILKDTNLSEKTEITKLRFSFTDSFLIIVLILTPEKVYSLTIQQNKDQLNHLKELENYYNINVTFFSNQENIYPIKNVSFDKIELDYNLDLSEKNKIVEYMLK